MRTTAEELSKKIKNIKNNQEKLLRILLENSIPKGKELDIILKHGRQHQNSIIKSLAALKAWREPGNQSNPLNQ